MARSRSKRTTWGHGLFTYHLLDGIRGAGDRDGDGRIGVAELFEHVAEAVERDARALGMIQKPWSCSIGAGGVYLSAPRCKGADATTKTRSCHRRLSPPSGSGASKVQRPPSARSSEQSTGPMSTSSPRSSTCSG